MGLQGDDNAGGNVTSLVSGDLRVTLDIVQGTLNATRLHDGCTFLQLQSLAWAAPANRSSPGASSVTATFSGLGLPWDYTIEETEWYPENEGRDSLVPLFFSTFGYGLLWNAPSYGTISIDEGGMAFNSSALSFVDLWITTACAACSAAPFPSLFQQAVDAMGHAPPLPSFATGFIQCKDRYRNQSQLMAVAQGYVERGLPISMIVIDWFHWQTLGDMQLNPKCWPDPPGMIENLRSLGIEIMITMWPFVAPQSINWPEYAENNTWLAVNASAGKITQFYDFIPSSVIDPTNASAANATFQKWWQGYGQYGSRAIWLDETEPDRGSYSYGDWDFAAGADYEVGAGWTSAWLQLFSDGFDSMGVPPSERFVLSRAIRAGTHRHGFAMWSGDTDSDWTTLAQKVADVQQAGFSLQAYWTSDTGGYNGGDPTNPDFQQLIVRWMQFSTFSPLMRLHGHRQGPADPVDECGYTAGPNEVWTLAPDAEHYDALTACLNLRESLRPYVANLSTVYADTGMPMVRPLFIAFPGDAACVGIEDAFMFGDTYLIKPIVAANVTQVTVYLPSLPPQQQQQQQWVYFFDNTVTSKGGGDVTISVTLATFPLFYIV